MILIYRVFTTIFYPIFLIIILCRIFLKKEDPKRYKEKIFSTYFNVIDKNKSKLIWFHAASIGEFKSIIPIIKLLNLRKNNIKFLVTTTTLSSGNLAKVNLKDITNVEHRYLPLDVPFLMERFLISWKPDYIFLVDSEIWPNLILKTKKYNIPLALINARLTSSSFKKWMLFPKTAKRIFSIFQLCICSNLETKNFLKQLKANNIFFEGNIKLIEQIDESKIKNLNEKFLSQKRFWLAASTHKEEDIFCLKTHLKLKEKFDDVVTIIAPRHIERADKIKLLFEKFSLKVQKLNKNEIIQEGNEIIIINSFGVLQSYFKYSKSVFIGKSMIKKLKNDGGQNPIEAAKLKCKIYHGPYIANFGEIYEILEKLGVSQKINNFEELSINLMKDLQNHLKINSEISNSIKNLEQKTSQEVMKLVDKFLNDNVN